jgi:hypothetical protein
MSREEKDREFYSLIRNANEEQLLALIAFAYAMKGAEPPERKPMPKWLCKRAIRILRKLQREALMQEDTETCNAAVELIRTVWMRKPE